MTSALWIPSEARKQQAQITSFIEHVKTQLSDTSYSALYQWSIEAPEAFWNTLWDYLNIQCSQPPSSTVDDIQKFPGAKWFLNARFNFAENLLGQPSDELAIIARLENGQRRTWTYKELHQDVSQCVSLLRSLGVQQGDRVAGFMPNIGETVVAMLATTSIGAIWSSCSPDFGINGVLDRFGQIEPKVLFACDGYFYNGKTIDKRQQ